METEIKLAPLSIRTTPTTLSIPEVLSCIFNLLEKDHKSLVSAACVNQIWFSEATRLLWANSDMSALMAVEASRRSIYAPKICDFTIRSVPDHLNLDFRLLRVLRLNNLPELRDENLNQYLQPSLEEVNLRYWPPTQFLYGLNQYCQSLRDFAHTDPQVDKRPGLVEFFTMNKSLRRIRLTLHPHDQDEILAAIAALSKVTSLEDLTTIGEIPINALLQLREPHSPSPFESVRRVRIKVGVPALPLLSTTFSAIASLSLELVINSDDHALDALVGLPLEYLHVHVAAGVKLSTQELLFLRDMKSLQSLIIGPTPLGRMERMPKFEISNDQFKQIFENLSNLESMVNWFAVDIANPDAALEDLGRSCPKLKNLRWYSSIDMTAWWDIPGPLFPSLKFAWVSSVSDRNLLSDTNESTAQLLAEILDRHAPELDRFVALNGYDFRTTNVDQLSQLTMRAHGRIKEIGQTKHAKEKNREVTGR
ncbi:hypothetical protein QM012_005355 [Aureobasidium pullulans]|uniref:F-box domain-containing protein n=1 Tax=Aureobasidium pullulans TaxID=5580 RepID=A0ABR0T594_AURPU